MPWGFAAAAIGSIASAGIGYAASQSAAHTQQKAANDASKVQMDMFNQIQGNEKPYLDAGTNALAALQRGFSPADFQHSPGYNFQRQEGLDAIRNNASATGGVNSGNTLKALTRYGQGVANQDYWNAYNAFTSNNQNLAGAGQNAAANLGGFGTQAAGNVANNIIGAGNAASAGQVAGATSGANAINGLSNNFLLAYMTNPGMFGGPTSQPAQVPTGQFPGAFPGGF